MVGPDYSRPPVVVPDNYRFAVAPATAESIADLPWFDVFRDPVLQQLVREALQNNYDLRIAAARVEEARARLESSDRSSIRRSISTPGRRATGLTSHRPAGVIRRQPKFPKLALRIRPGMGARCLWQNPAQHGSRDGISRYGAGPARCPYYLSGRRSSVLFHSPGAGSELEIARRTVQT